MALLAIDHFNLATPLGSFLPLVAWHYKADRRLLHWPTVDASQPPVCVPRRPAPSSCSASCHGLSDRQSSFDPNVSSPYLAHSFSRCSGRIAPAASAAYDPLPW